MAWKRVTVKGKGGLLGNGVWADAHWTEYHLLTPSGIVLATVVKTGGPEVGDYPWVWWEADGDHSGRAGSLAEAKNAAEDARIGEGMKEAG